MKQYLFLILILISYIDIYCQEKIISTGDEWLYYDQNVSLPNNWYSINNLSLDWKKGKSPLGYGDDIIETSINFGNDPNNKDITKYFQKSFLISDPYKYLIYKLNIQRDDGVVIYLNGREILRNNMPQGIITDTTKANGLVFSTSNEIIKYTKLISSDDFIAGINTLSASVHQARRTSSDCLFNLELEGSNDASIIPLLLKEQAINNLNLSLKLKEINYAQDVEKKNLEIEFLKESKSNIKFLFIVVIILLSISIIFIFYFYKNFNTKHKELIKNNTKLKSINTNKDREIMNVTLGSIHDKQFIKELKKDLEESINNSLTKNEQERIIKRVLNNIDYNLDFSEDWENLKKHFNTVYSGFVDKLNNLHPTLTDIELRHCIFIKLRMQTKEIAQILHIDPRSVQASRYRLKKKMDLGEDVDLKEYLQSF